MQERVSHDTKVVNNSEIPNKYMKISKEQIKKITEHCSTEGHEVRFRDIAYCVLKDVFSDAVLAYKAIFDADASYIVISNYDKSAKTKAVKKYMTENNLLGHKIISSTTLPTEADITFEANKAELVKMLEDVDRAFDDGLIDYKDAAKLKVDIRTKLNDKFSVSEDSGAQVIFVQPKFNHICQHTQKECWLQTKEYAMEHWGLIEKPITE